MALRLQFLVLFLLILISQESCAKIRKFKSKFTRKDTALIPWQSIVNSIAENDQPYGVNIWYVNKRKFRGKTMRSVVRTLFNNIPSTQVNFDDLRRRKNFLYLLKRPKMKQTIASMNVIFLQLYQRSNRFKIISSVLDMVAETVRPIPQPKILVIIFGGEQRDQTLIKELKRQLYVEANKLCLDLTFILVFKNKKLMPMVWYILLFENRYVSKPLNVTKDLLFPDKLKNMAEYRIRLSSHHFRTINDMHRYIGNEYKKPFTSYYTKPWEQTKVFCEVSNCTVTFVRHGHSFHVHFTISNLQQQDYFSGTYSNVYIIKKRWAAIPHIKEELIEQHLDCRKILFFTLSIVILLGFCQLLKSFLGLDRSQWKIVDVFRLTVLGSPLSASNGLLNKLFHLFLIILSFYVSNGLIDVATDFKITVTQVPVRSEIGLLNFNVPIISYDDGNDLHLPKKRVFSCRQNYECMFNQLDLLWDRNDRIVIFDDDILSLKSAQYKKWYKKKGFRLAKFNVVARCGATQFTLLQPFVEKFNKIILQTIDYGILKRLSRELYVNSYNLELDEENYDIVGSNEVDFYRSLLLVLILFHFFAVSFLVIEMNVIRIKLKAQKLKEWYTGWRLRRQN